MKIKVLVITYDFFPDNSPNTYRWLNVLKEWKKRDVEIFVLASQKSVFTNYEEFEGIKIYRTGNSWFDKIKNKIFKISQSSNSSLTEQNKIISKESFIRKIYNQTWKKVYFPDFAFLWQSSAYKKAKELITIENITNVITVSWPFSGHVVGSKLKKNYNIFWIADTIDPFFLSKAVNNNLLYNSLNYRYEKKILSTADIVTVLTDKLKEKYASLYPLIEKKIIVIHNIFVPYELNQSECIVDAKKIKLVFVGTLTPLTRSPDNLLRLFNNLLKIESREYNLELHFYGNLVQCNTIFSQYDFLLNKSLFLHGVIPRENIPAILNDATILVNIGNSNEFQEPSKILEYVYLKKPILNVCSVEDDSSKELLSDYPLNFNVFSSEISDNKKLIEVYKFMTKSDFIGNEHIEKILQKYLLQEVEMRYFELLKKY
ncbi:MAG: hypothetical protein Q8S41_03625 [Lutibacter sp.]|nr:hypothetical protein [Lutibacter sp.]